MDRIFGVVVGLATMYLMLSILASHIQELLATKSQARTTLLRSAITSLLGSQILTTAFYDHPLIKGLVPAPTGTSKPSKVVAPTYIPADIFRKVLLTILNQTYTPQSTALKDIFAKMPDGNLRQSLMGITLDIADQQGIASAIENWYLSAMDRTIGLYKRQTQGSLLIVGFILAVIFNANTFHAAQVLWTTPSARDAAQTLAQQCIQNKVCVPKPDAPRSGTSAPAPGTTGDLKPLEDSINKLPVGWSPESMDAWKNAWKNWGNAKAADAHTAPPVPSRASQFGSDAVTLLIVIAGWFFTSVAVSWGAPFWFDLLNQIVNLRIAGPKPDTKNSGPAKAAADPTS
jgi:hypothetical protein